jgi:hypothetical protein
MQITTSDDVDGPPCIDRKSSSLHACNTTPKSCFVSLGKILCRHHMYGVAGWGYTVYYVPIHLNICMHINLVLNLESPQLLKTQQLMIRLNICIRNNESFKTRPILYIFWQILIFKMWQSMELLWNKIFPNFVLQSCTMVCHNVTLCDNVHYCMIIYYSHKSFKIVYLVSSFFLITLSK